MVEILIRSVSSWVKVSKICSVFFLVVNNNLIFLLRKFLWKSFPSSECEWTRYWVVQLKFLRKFPDAWFLSVNCSFWSFLEFVIKWGKFIMILWQIYTFYKWNWYCSLKASCHWNQSIVTRNFLLNFFVIKCTNISGQRKLLCMLGSF